MIKWLRKLAHGRSRYADEAPESENQALLIRIYRDRLYADCFSVDEIARLEDELHIVLGDTCEVDGHDIGAMDATIYVYAPSAEFAFAACEVLLREDRLTEQAEVTLRIGPPGSPERVVSIGDTNDR